MKRVLLPFVVLFVLLSFSMTALAQSNNAVQYMIVTNSSRNINSQLDAVVAARGGEIAFTIPEIGVAVATSSNLNFMADMSNIQGIVGVFPDMVAELPSRGVEATIQNHNDFPYAAGTDLRGLLWGIDEVDAPAAWAAGNTGQDTLVAVLDAGIDFDHPDLAPNIREDLSASYVVGEDWKIQPGYNFNHGTHVAGTIAAVNDGDGVVGVAPDAELMVVKVCREFSPGCPGSAILGGIIHAANNGADVANMSLGGIRIWGNDWWFDFCLGQGLSRPECAQLASQFLTGQADYVQSAILVYMRAFRYAERQGMTIITSAGNSAIDADHNKDMWLGFADFPGTVGISALGPTNYCLNDAVNPDADVNELAYYSNFGRSVIDFSAPGGNAAMYAFGLPGATNPCTLGGHTLETGIFDLTLSTINGGWGWAQGTSMAAPHATGVAALLITANGGDMSPAALKRALANTAEDLGAVGEDPVHGSGRVNSGY